MKSAGSGTGESSPDAAWSIFFGSTTRAPSMSAMSGPHHWDSSSGGVPTWTIVTTPRTSDSGRHPAGTSIVIGSPNLDRIVAGSKTGAAGAFAYGEIEAGDVSGVAAAAEGTFDVAGDEDPATEPHAATSEAMTKASVAARPRAGPTMSRFLSDSLE